METIIVAIISTLGIISTTLIQSIQASKKDTIERKLTDLQIAIKKESLDSAKNDLIILMSRIHNGYVPTTEEKMILHETKRKYNDLGGDSYVDDMFDKLLKEGKL